MPVLSFRRQTTTAEPVTAGDVTVTPEARAWIVRLPGGGFVWNRPVAVRVERGGKVRRLTIRDWTGRAVALLFGLALASATLLILSFVQRRRKTRE